MTSIIIGTKDRLEYLKKLILSIHLNTEDYEIIVVDDASTDGTKEWAKDNSIYIRNEKSVPVAVAWNMGAEKAKGEYLVFLNDDMMTTPNWLSSQLEFYKKHPLVGSLAFKTIDDQGNVNSRGHSFNRLTPYLPDESALEVDYSDHPFVKKSLWERVGGFNAHGQMYYEDADFGLKLQSRGFKNYYNKDAVLVHQVVGLRVGTDEDKKKRKYNEEVLQQESKVSFYKMWETYLLNK